MDNLNAVSEKVAAEIMDLVRTSETPLTLSEIEKISRTLLQEIGRQAISQVIQVTETVYPESMQYEKGHETTY